MKKIYIGLGCLAALTVSGCQKDNSDDSSVKEYKVRLLTGITDQDEVALGTRSLPTGYAASNFSNDPGQIGIFMTTDDATSYSAISGTYRWVSGDQWSSNVYIKYDEEDPSASINDYYVYGFMPVIDGVGASIKATTSFSTGATMTLLNVPPTSPYDLCIITGVLKGERDGADYKSITDVDVKVGKYSYQASADNAMYLLFDHIYSKIAIKMMVNSTYNELRTIKVKEMKMTGSAPAVNIDVSYFNNGTAPTTTITAAAGSTSISSTLLSSETELTTEMLDLTTFHCANVLSSVTLTTTFDVYDKKGNVLRSNCKTSNSIHINTLEVGKSYTLEAVVNPTYLYQLGETDLDLPSIAVNNN